MFELGKETSNEWCEGVTDEEYVKKTMDAYDHIHEAYHAKAWMCGRKTMEENFTLGKTPDLRKIDYKIPRTDFIAKKDAKVYCLSIDPKGKLGWPASYIESYNGRSEAHVVEILTESVTDEFLDFLQRMEISYLFAGEKELDLELLLEKVKNILNVEVLLLEGGGNDESSDRCLRKNRYSKKLKNVRLCMFLRFGNRKTNKNIQKSLCKQAGKCYLIVRRRNNEQKNKKTNIVVRAEMKKLTKKAADMNLKELASYIDYSVLKPEFTPEEIINLTKDGVKLGCATICINPGYMELCEPYVKGTDTMLCPVTDFPFGTSSTKSKVEQIEDVAKYDTVKEIDVVANFGMIRAGKYDEVTEDIKACAETAHKYGRELKVIFETDALNEEQVRKACHCAMEAGADFVKTSTGFLTGFESNGATPEIIKVMMEEVGDQCKVKGSGCIRTREHFLQLIDMGIDRMGVGYRSVPVVLNLEK